MKSFYDNNQGSLALVEEKVLIMNDYKVVPQHEKQIAQVITLQQTPDFIQRRQADKAKAERRELERQYDEAIFMSNRASFVERQEKKEQEAYQASLTTGQKVFNGVKNWVVNFINE